MMFRTAAVALLLAAIGFTVHAAPPAQAAAPAPPLTGEVLETQNVDGYTYLRLKTAQQGEVWAAVPTTTVKKGAQVTIGNPMTMHDFESKTLKKKFDTIVFGQIVEPGAKAASPHGAAPATNAPTGDGGQGAEGHRPRCEDRRRSGHGQGHAEGQDGARARPGGEGQPRHHRQELGPSAGRLGLGRGTAPTTSS